MPLIAIALSSCRWRCLNYWCPLRPRSGESLKTLDGQTRSLQQQTLLITANDQPVALAGVMGGEETEVHDGTQNLVLEAALFEPVAIRRSARTKAYGQRRLPATSAA
jgi:phenylalanyl-tRNA synthetase beta subunit